MRRSFLTPLVLCLLGAASPAGAQQRPLLTEDPQTVGPGQALVEAGFDYERDVEFPVSGLTGNLVRAGTFGLSVGISSIAELQIDGGLYNHLSIVERGEAPLAELLRVDGDTTSSVQDLVLGTKVRFVAEGVRAPAFGVRLATKLPNASNESGLGLDTMDFFASLIVGKTVQSVRVVGNAGFAILSDPTRGDRQNDVLTYGVSFARAITETAELVGEVNGRVSTRRGSAPPGTETRAVMRLGSRYTRGPVRLDAALLLGMTAPDADVGFTAGLTYVFQAFQIQ